MRSTFIRTSALVSLGVVLLLGSACGSSGQEDAGGDGISVVTTTPLLAEFAGRVVGEDASVSALIPRGVDLHSWQPSTGAARDVAEADVLVVNGHNLEESLLSIVEENAGDGVPIVVASAGLDALEGGHDHEGEDADHADEQHAADDLVTAPGDPHFWLSVPNAVRYVENIRDGLAAADPDHAEGYQSRAEEFIAELQALDAEVRSTLEAIPAEARKIVVFHDAYEYLAHEYGFEVAAAVAPANPNQETSAQAIAAIVDEVRSLGVGAVYKEPQFSAQSLDLIAQETGVRVLALHSTLGDDTPTYAEMMRANAQALVDGLAG